MPRRTLEAKRRRASGLARASGFAVEDEVGDGEEGAAEFGVFENAEAFFGAIGVFDGEAAGMFEGSGIADERGDLLRADGLETFFAENGSDQFPPRGVAIVTAVRVRAALH